jgi:hypothetical protein
LSQQGEVVFQGLAESEAGVNHDAPLLDPAHLAREDALREEGMHLAHHIVVVRRLLHHARLALHVHQDHDRTRSSRSIKRAIELKRPDVVDHAGARGQRRAHHLGLGCIDRNRQGGFTREALDHGHDTLQFLVDRHFTRTGPGRFAPDVEPIGTLLRQHQPMRDGRIDGRMQATVGERIRGDIDDAKYPGTVQREEATGAIETGRGVEHGFRRGMQREVSRGIATRPSLGFPGFGPGLRDSAGVLRRRCRSATSSQSTEICCTSAGRGPASTASGGWRLQQLAGWSSMATQKRVPGSASPLACSNQPMRES